MLVCLGDRLWTSDGHEAGTVEWMLLDPTAHRVNAVVVRRGLILRHALVVPIAELQVVETGEWGRRLLVRRTRSDLDTLPEFHRELYTGELARQLTGERPTPFYLPGWIPPASLEQPAPSTEAIELGDLVRSIDEANAVLHRGAAVVTAEGERIGHLHELCADVTSGHIVRVTVRHGLPPHEIDIPVDALSGADDGRLSLRWWRQDFERALHPA
ncbi:MAG: PRC-barrel domain-containing protein [Thermomicrobium sp.]|nr:PRC-barrel domain-containing protein [Thermomicrobium sp.]